VTIVAERSLLTEHAV